jgi:hypothetical protein
LSSVDKFIEAGLPLLDFGLSPVALETAIEMSSLFEGKAKITARKLHPSLEI